MFQFSSAGRNAVDEVTLAGTRVVRWLWPVTMSLATIDFFRSHRLVWNSNHPDAAPSVATTMIFWIFDPGEKCLSCFSS